MLHSEQLEMIKREFSNLMGYIGIPLSDLVVEQTRDKEGGSTVVQVFLRAEDPKILIGERGQTLFEIQHLLRLLLRKKIADPFYLSVDINEYKKNKEAYLCDLARAVADEVTLFKKPKELPPMSASERRVIHVALSGRSDVMSESAGEGADRHVVIKPKS